MIPQIVTDTAGSCIILMAAVGVLLGLIFMFNKLRLQDEQRRIIQLKAMRDFKTPEGGLVIAYGIRDDELLYEPFAAPAPRASKQSLEYADSPNVDRALHNDALHVLRETIKEFGKSSERILGIDAFSAEFATRWRKATDYLAQYWGVKKTQVGGSEEAGTFIGPLYENVAQLEYDVTFKRMPITHSPAASG